ncbi:MAG: aminotransferase class V-fold PLP-dependent enzyme [Bacteroidetes bacterium]|nr:aminotransferase class V-fold PLP-dependent enzyme [Bacteroidota bacterium]MBT7462932.1 aminotransferase class V-fold PLP-dependent enzyme [Bacteroidota bacterium]
MKKDPAMRLQDTLKINEFNSVNPLISDSATFSFPDAPTMSDCFEGKVDNAFLYSRHWNPTNLKFTQSLAAMENTEAAWVTGSGMAAITCAILEICKTGDHIISSMTTYGGTFAFLKNYAPLLGIEVSFVDITNLDQIVRAIRPNTKMIYSESVTNPLLQITDIPALSSLARDNKMQLVIDNTFTPMIINPCELGAHVTVYSMTKFINGKNDCVAGAICGTKEFIDALTDVHTGTAMLLGPVLDPLRASSIHKNLFTLHIRMQKHSENAMFLAKAFEKRGIRSNYPGLPSHPQHELFKQIMNPEFGFGGILAIDLKTKENANKLMVAMQNRDLGYLAVSLGYYKTLFSNSGSSTSSEVPIELQEEMGLSEGLVRFSVGLDQNIEHTWEQIEICLNEIE